MKRAEWATSAARRCNVRPCAALGQMCQRTLQRAADDRNAIFRLERRNIGATSEVGLYRALASTIVASKSSGREAPQRPVCLRHANRSFPASGGYAAAG